MNKIAIRVGAAIAVIGAAYVGTSWWLGKKVETRYQSLLDRAVAQLGADKFAERRYERGVFGAKSTVVLQFQFPASPGEDEATEQQGAEPTPPDADKKPTNRTVRITLQDDIQHGPLAGATPAAARIHTRVMAVEGLDEDVRQAFAKASAPEFVTFVGFDSSFSGKMTLAAGEAIDPKLAANNAQWQTLTYDYRISADGNKVDGIVTWPQFAFQVEEAGVDDEGEPDPDAATGMKIRMENLQANFNYTQADDQWLLAPGKGHGTVAVLDVTQRGVGQKEFKPLLSMKDLKMDTETVQNGANLDSTFQSVAQGSLGGVDLKEMRLESKLLRMNPQALASAQKVLVHLFSGKPDEDPLPPGATEAMMKAFLDAKPEYRDSYSATTVDGHTGQFGYGFAVGDAPEGQAQPNPAMPWQMTAIQRVKFDAALRLPKAMLPMLHGLLNEPETTVDDLTEALGEYVEEGLLKEENGAFVSKVDFGSGRLLVNGEPPRLGGIFGGR